METDREIGICSRLKPGRQTMDQHPYSAAALGDVPRRRPSLASPLPPTAIVPSTPLPRAKLSLANHHHHQPSFQQRPSTAPATSTSSNLSDPHSTRGMMKRLLAKPAPPSSPSSSPSPSTMSPGFHRVNTNEDYQEKHLQDQDPVQEITISSSLPTDTLLTPRSINEFDKSIRALDLVGQIDISMVPCTTTSLDFFTEPSDYAKKQRNVFRQSPSGTAITTPSVPTSSSSEYLGLGDDSTFSTPTFEPSTTSTIPLRPIRSSSPLTRYSTPNKSSTPNGSGPGRPQATHNYPPKPINVEQSPVTSRHTVFGDNSVTIVTGGPEDSFGNASGEYQDKWGEQHSNDGGAGLTHTPSGKWSKNHSDHPGRSKPSLHKSKRSSSVDEDQGMVNKSRDVPAGDSPSRRFWKLVKKISVNSLREKNQSDSDHPPPVPPLPSDLTNDSFHQHRTQNESSLVDNRLKKSASTSTLASSLTTPLDKADNTTIVASTLPLTSAQSHIKHPCSAPHSPPTSGPRPSTTTRSSSPSSDVASSRFFNRQSARSSTSSFGEESTPLPPLPKKSTSTIIKRKTNVNDTNPSRKLQQHIISPSELSRDHFTSDINPITITMPIYQPPQFMEDDWTIVRSPSVELEALSLPPPPRQLFNVVGIGAILDRRKTTSGQGSKLKARASEMNMSKMINISSEQVNDQTRDVSNNACSQKDSEKNTIETTKSELGDKDNHIYGLNTTDRDSNLSQSPTIPSFSTSSAINSFPTRKVSSSLSARSPIAGSPDTSNRSSGSVFSTVNMLRSPSRSPQSPGPRTAFGRVRQHLFGTNDVCGKAEEEKEGDEVLNPPPSSLKLPSNPPQQHERQAKARKRHRHSSGDTTTKSRSTHATFTSSISMPGSPIITSPHRRSMSFNTSSPVLPPHKLFTSASSSPSPCHDVPRTSSPFSTLTPSPSRTSNSGHRTRSSSNLRSAFSSRKLTRVSHSSPSSASLSASPGHGSPPYRGRPSSSSSHRAIGSLMSRSISGVSTKSHPPHPVIPSQPRTQLSEQEKADKWNDLLARSARAGGTLHLAAGSRLLDSDNI